jgi:hypothetical protein
MAPRSSAAVNTKVARRRKDSAVIGGTTYVQTALQECNSRHDAIGCPRSAVDQRSLSVEALLSRSTNAETHPHLDAYRERVRARPPPRPAIGRCSLARRPTMQTSPLRAGDSKVLSVVTPRAKWPGSRPHSLVSWRRDHRLAAIHLEGPGRGSDLHNAERDYPRSPGASVITIAGVFSRVYPSIPNRNTKSEGECGPWVSPRHALQRV